MKKKATPGSRYYLVPLIQLLPGMLLLLLLLLLPIIPLLLKVLLLLLHCSQQLLRVQFSCS